MNPSVPRARSVRREGARVWIEGVPAEQVGAGWDMLMRGMAILLQHRGEAAPLDDLMAYSGDAFNLCFASHWQGAACLCAPTDALANVAAAYGFEHEWLLPRTDSAMRRLAKGSRRAITNEVLGRIRESIDAGRPALVGGCADQGCGPWSVVVGYDSDALQLCHVGLGEPYRWTGVRGLNVESETDGYWNGRVRGAVLPDFVGGWLADPAFLLGGKTPRPGNRERAVAALALAIRVFRAPEHRISRWGGVTYHFGENAYVQWARALAKLDYPADLKRRRPKAAYDWYEMGNMDVMLDCVVRGRTAAAQFCEKVADSMGNAKPSLRAAARFYRKEVVIAQDSFPAFLKGRDAQRAEWLSDPERREVGAAAVRVMLERERAAVREIEQAVTAAGIEVPAAPLHHQLERAQPAQEPTEQA